MLVYVYIISRSYVRVMLTLRATESRYNTIAWYMIDILYS